MASATPRHHIVGMVLLTFIFQLLIHLLEAHHDTAIIKASDPSKPTADWHRLDAKSWTIIHLWVAILLVWPDTGLLMAVPLIGWLAMVGLTIRLMVMTIYLNKVRGLPLTHLGGGTIDRQISRMGFVKSMVMAGAFVLISISILLLLL